MTSTASACCVYAGWNRWCATICLGIQFPRTLNTCVLKENVKTPLTKQLAKKGGVVFAAYCMADPSILAYGFIKGNAHLLLEKGLLDPVTFRASSTPEELFELHRTEDIATLRSHFPVTPLHLIATDGYANHMRDALAAMDEATYQLYLQYHLATCERPDMLGYSHHTLDIFRKD